MKILFVNASKQWEGRTYQEYPYGIGILATLTSEAGHSVHILDMAVDKRDVFSVIASFQPEVVAVSFFSPALQIASELIRALKKSYSGIIMAGGIHSTLYPESVLSYGADLVMIGEGELTILSVLQAIQLPPGQARDTALGNIPDLAYIDHFGKTLRTRSQTQSVDLDALPIMNRNLFNLDLYSHHTILTSRCCPYQCRFCCSWAPGGKRGRVMSPDRILRELEWLVSSYGPLTLYWGDEIFFWNRRDRLDFCRILEKKHLPIRFIMQIRADLIDVELVARLIRVGCVKICIGAESGSDVLLRTANKKVTAAQVEQAIKICVEAGVPCKTWWMVGLPGGDREDQLMALDIISRARPNEVAVHQFVPLPGSEFWDHADQYGICLPKETQFNSLSYYANPEKLNYKYISGQELNEILRIYERRLLEMGYIPTDLAGPDDTYVFTTPFQNTTFDI